MINKLIKLLTNPQGALVQIVLDQVSKIFKLDKVLSYVEDDNELDIQMRDIEQKCTDIGFKVTTMQTVIKDLGEDTHPPVIDVEEWEELKADMKKIRNMKAFKNKLGK